MTQQQEVDELFAEVGDYKHGSIRRIRLTNFLTYAHVEFSPGPRYVFFIPPFSLRFKAFSCHCHSIITHHSLGCLWLHARFVDQKNENCYSKLTSSSLAVLIFQLFSIVYVLYDSLHFVGKGWTWLLDRTEPARWVVFRFLSVCLFANAPDTEEGGLVFNFSFVSFVKIWVWESNPPPPPRLPSCCRFNSPSIVRPFNLFTCLCFWFLCNDCTSPPSCVQFVWG